MGEEEIIKISEITLKWSDWYPWDEVKKNVRGCNGIKIPEEPGVYEVKYKNEDERLTIGKASKLRRRIRQGFVNGNIPHSAGKKIREKENTTEIVIRWATTDRPAAVEEELHKRHYKKFQKLPKYVKHT